MVAPNTTSFQCTKSPFTLASPTSGGRLPVRRISHASIDKLAAAKARKSLSSKTLPIKKRAIKSKAVRFSEAPKVVQINTQANATWYQPRDYATIKMDLIRSIRAIHSVFQGAPGTAQLDLNEHCLRGIETTISTDLHQRRKFRIRNTTQSVLEHQRRQRMAGAQVDPCALRAISLQFTKDAQESAVSAGKMDSQL